MDNDLKPTIINKIINLQEIVKNIIRANQLYKTTGFIEINSLNSCVTFAESIYSKLRHLLNTIKNETANENSIAALQTIIEEISILISLYGCDTLDNLIMICIGNKYTIGEKYTSKYTLLNTYFSPLRYKTIHWNKCKPNEEDIVKKSDNFECFDIDESFDINFQTRIYGIKIAIHNIEKRHTIMVYGVMEDVILDLIEDKGIQDRINDLNNNKPIEYPHYNLKTYERFVKCITLKELLIFSCEELKGHYIAFIENFVNNINKKPLLQVINEFNEKEMIDKRRTLMTLLINANENSHYLAYLLYDLLSNDIHGMIDTYEQTTIYDSLPFTIKKYFREAMKYIMCYANKLSKIENTKISLEQRICLMKTDDTVKEKAMVKLKEVKLKTEDTGSGSKAMHFIDGLLKIPFGVYREEQILREIPCIISLFNDLIKHLNTFTPHVKLPFSIKTNYTSIEVYKFLHLLKNNYKNEVYMYIWASFKTALGSMSKKNILDSINELLSTFPELNAPPMKYRTKPVAQLRAQLLVDLEPFLNIDEKKDSLYNEINKKTTAFDVLDFNKRLSTIDTKINNVNNFMKNMTETLDNSVYGHIKAKRQIERIIGQWVNGDITGYCFGFEGPPGVGKTSLAKKGISHCLTDEEGVARPFAFIAMGGSTNASTLDGHNYTYVGSTWGRIVDILMDTKIMNPIIFIDELDKVSKTENGKEIIGILTHLVDQTQNDAFQDKYFNGINLNLSKALFIFSYNDADLIDRILLDRIHRIKFDHLTNEDKLIISRKFILPEIYKKMGLLDMIEISDDTIEFIIEQYTAEPGVRKLKELMFEIFGEINLNTLKNKDNYTSALTIPIIITIDAIKDNYLKERREMKLMKIHAIPKIGIINGLWANSMGKGGVLPIEASFFPTGTFLELKLTGMQGDVMKESMTVAKSLAWTLFARERAQTLKFQSEMEESKNQGLHIHVPEGATPKDGPSAGTAITMVLYSLFTGKKIKNDVAITGEICLQGRVTAIGGLDLKLLGGIRAGVKTFIYPTDNKKDFTDFIEKYGSKIAIKDISFFSVETIDEVIPLIFE